MKHLILLTILVSSLVITHSSFSAPPNVLFIFSDDHAQAAISAYGSKVNQTPNIDRIAKGGARFTNSFVTNSICTPSRATLLTQDPAEQHNLLHSQADAKHPEIAAKFTELKTELTRLQKEYQDDGLYADPANWPKGSADGPFDAYQTTGTKSVSEAITSSVSK